MARIGIPGRVGPGSDDWSAQEIERRRTWEREFSAALPTVVKGIVSDLSTAQGTLATTVTDLGIAQGTLATSVTRQSEQVQTYSRTLLQSELAVVGAGATYPNYNLTWDITAPSWATSGTVLAYTVPSWGGTIPASTTVQMIAMPLSTWDSNAPTVGFEADIYNDGGAGGTKLILNQNHTHPVEVQGAAGFSTTALRMGIWWVKTTAFTPTTTVSMNLSATIVWN